MARASGGNLEEKQVRRRRKEKKMWRVPGERRLLEHLVEDVQSGQEKIMSRRKEDKGTKDGWAKWANGWKKQLHETADPIVLREGKNKRKSEHKWCENLEETNRYGIGKKKRRCWLCQKEGILKCLVEDVQSGQEKSYAWKRSCMEERTGRQRNKGSLSKIYKQVKKASTRNRDVRKLLRQG